MQDPEEKAASTLIFHLTSLQHESEIINTLLKSSNCSLNAKEARSIGSNSPSHPSAEARVDIFAEGFIYLKSGKQCQSALQKMK